MQEAFSSSESKHTLMRILRESGFKRIRGFKGFYGCADATVGIQGRSISRSAPVDHPAEFIVQFYQNLTDLGPNHPVRRFLRSLAEPCAHGLGGQEPQYGIQEYTH